MGSKDALLTMMELHTVLLLQKNFSFTAMGSHTGASLTEYPADPGAAGLMEPGTARWRLSDGVSREAAPAKAGARSYRWT